MAALVTGRAVAEVAREFQVPTSTISRWKTRVPSIVGMEDAEGVTPQSEVAALLLDYLRSGLGTVIAQHAVMQDQEYLQRQSASELAILHGVLIDKLVRLLEALDGGPIG